MRKYLIVLIGALLWLALSAPLAAFSSTPPAAMGFQADAVSAASPNYRTFTEAELKSIKKYKQTLNVDEDIVAISETLAGGHYTCQKASPPHTYFEQDWRGVDLAYLLEQEVGLKDGTTGIRVIAEDGYAVTLTLDQMRGNNNPRGLPTLLAYMNGPPSAENPNAPNGAGAPFVAPVPVDRELDDEEGPFRLVMPQGVEGPAPENTLYNAPAGTGDDNWNLAVRMVRAIEVQPLPPGIPALDYKSIPAGEVMVYGNILNRRTLTLDQLKSIYPVTADYAWAKSYDSTVETGTDTCTGIQVPYLLDQVVGLQDTATDVMFLAADGWGFKDLWPLDEIRAEYGDDFVKFMLAWNVDGNELGPEPEGDGPLRMIKPQYDPDDTNLNKWLKWVRAIQVEPMGDDPGVDPTQIPTDRIIVSGAIDAGNVPNEWFFAEGYTGPGFDTYICVANPNSWATHVIIDFYIEGGGTERQEFDLAARTRTTVNAEAIIGEGREFATRVEGYHGDSILAERAMYWNGMGAGHCASGVNAPADTWYLAEGCTAGGFETWVLLENPGTEDATVKVTYNTGGGKQAGADKVVPAQSRATIDIAADGATDLWDVSTMLESDRPIVAERAVYWDNKRGGHCASGVKAPAEQWYLAEGASAGGFETFILVQNPNDHPVPVALSFMTSTGLQEPPEWQGVEIPANSRQTFRVNDKIDDLDVSTKVQALMGGQVIAERAMYWNGKASGHDSHGLTSPSFRSYLAEGCTAGGFQTWVLLQNPGPSDATVYITYQTETGAVEREPLVLPAGRRTSVPVLDDVGETNDVSTIVRSSTPIVAERSVYWNGSIEGSCSTGYSSW